MGSYDSSSDEEMMSSMVRAKRKVVKKAIVEESSSSDSEDDVPIAQLKRNKANALKKAKAPAKSPVKTKTVKKAAKSSVKAKTPTKTKTTPAKRKSVTKQPTTTRISSNATPSSEIYSKSDKGKLIQSVLCRWWYAIEWPEKEILDLPIPENCDPLQGFPGVYVHTRGESVGKIVDRRHMETCPSFKNFARKSSEELVSLLQTAIDNQIKELRKHEGEESTTEVALGTLKKWATKINCSKADKEAEKVLRVAGMALP